MSIVESTISNFNPSTSSDRLLVGVDEIAAELNRPHRQVNHWLDRGFIKCASKRGHLWTAPRKRLRQEFGLLD